MKNSRSKKSDFATRIQQAWHRQLFEKQADWAKEARLEAIENRTRLHPLRNEFSWGARVFYGETDE